MTEFFLPWILISIAVPALGTLFIVGQRNPEVARRRSIVICSLALLSTLAMWWDFHRLSVGAATDRADPLGRLFGVDSFVIDAISAPLVPLAALLHLATAMSTLRTKVRRFSFTGMLVNESILMATFSCRSPGAIVLLLAAGVVLPFLELKERGRPVRVFALHMGLFVLLMSVGWSLTWNPDGAMFPLGIVLLMAGVLLRSGCVPVHAWMTDLFEHASFGTALLFVTPMVGAYAAVRLVLPIAPDWAVHSIALMSLVTSFYAAGMAIVQKEARRFFCYLLLSHSSLILVGLETATPVGLTGSLVLWLSDALAMAGFGLTLRSMESRLGRISLAHYRGMYEHTPTFAVFFLLTGLASIGFPGAFGFVGMELLISGAVETYYLVGTIVVLAGALNGIAILAAYFRLFTGARHVASIPLSLRGAEKVAVLSLAALIIVNGVYPQPSIESRYEAAIQIVDSRKRLPPPASQPQVAAGPSRLALPAGPANEVAIRE